MAEALAFSAPAGVAEGLLEHIGLHVMIENMAVRSMGSALVRNMLSEGVQESSQQAAENFIRWAANKYSGAKIEEADGWKDLIYDSVYAGILGSMTSFPVSVAGSTANRRVSKEAAEAFEQAGMNAQEARATAGYLAYNDRVGTMAHALDEARTTGNFDRALAVFTEQAETVENKTGRKFWSTLDRDEQETFMRSLLVPPERFSADAVQIANDMTDPDTYVDPTPEGMAKSFAEGLESYKSETDSRLDALFDEDAEALARAEEKSAQQRKLLERRTDLSDTDKRIIGDMLEAFNASVADKFGAENLQELEVRGQETFDLSEATQEQVDEFNKRAGIYEYENGLTREAAQMKAYQEIFGTDAKQAEAFVETYDEIPFFQTVHAAIADVSTAHDIKTVRDDAERYLKDIVRKQDIVHPKLGKIRVSGKGIDEFTKFSSDIRKLALVPHLKELIETSTVGEEEPPKHPRKDGIVKFIPLYNEAVIDGVPAKTETLVGVDENGNLFYDVFLDGKRDRKNSNSEAKPEPVSTASDINIEISETKGKRFYQSVPSVLTERAGGPKIADDAETVDVVEIPENAVPKFEKTADLRNWLIGKFEDIGNVTIKSTGENVDFNVTAAQRTLKNARQKRNNIAYPEIEKVVSGAKYSGFRVADERHKDRVKGQDVYHSAVIYEGRPYSVEFYVDVPLKGGKDNFAGNKISRIEIAPSGTQVSSEKQNPQASQQGAIHTISMGVLRGKVNPARFKDGVLYQTAPTVRGAYYPENRVIELLKNANPSTIVHELGHHFTMQYLNLLQENGREAEANGILEWIGAKSIDNITVEQWEKLADAFIVYTKEGFAPSSKLDDLFAALKKYLTTLYEKLVKESGRLPEINDDVREFFDTMLTVDNKTDADFKQMLKQARDLREVVKGVLKGEALEVNGLNVEDVKNLVRALHTRMPRAPKTLEQKLRAAGGIDLDFARTTDLVPLMGASEDKFGKSGLFRKNGKFGDEAAIVEFLKGEGYLQDADTAQAVADQWRQAEEVLENASSSYSPADVATLEARENIDAAIRAAQEALAGIDYDALLEGLAAFRSVGAVGASKDVIKYIDNQIKRIQTDAKRLSAKLVKEARRDTERLIRREMKQKAKEERDTLKERQKEIVTFIRSYPIENKNGLISSVQKAFTAKSLSDILEEVRKKAETYYETEKRRRLKSKIESIVKKTKPSSVKNQKFDYDRNVLFKKIRDISKYTQIKAAEELERTAASVNEEEELTPQDLILRKYLTFKAKGMKASSALMESLLEDLTAAISEGRAEKEEADFEKRKDLAIQKNAVRQAIVKRSQKAGADLWLRVSFTCYFRPQSHTKGGCGFMRKKRFVYAPEWISGSLK